MAAQHPANWSVPVAALKCGASNPHTHTQHSSAQLCDGPATTHFTIANIRYWQNRLNVPHTQHTHTHTPHLIPSISCPSSFGLRYFCQDIIGGCRRHCTVTMLPPASTPFIDSLQRENRHFRLVSWSSLLSKGFFCHRPGERHTHRRRRTAVAFYTPSIQ